MAPSDSPRSVDPEPAIPYMRPIRWVALVIIAIGLLFLWQTVLIRDVGTYAAVSARAFPYATGIGILLSGIWLFLLPGAVPGPDSPERTHLDWFRLLLMFVAAVAYALVFDSLGYLISTALVLLAGSQILGERRHWVRDLIVSVALAVVLNYSFARLLGINLPQGLIGF